MNWCHTGIKTHTTQTFDIYQATQTLRKSGRQSSGFFVTEILRKCMSIKLSDRRRFNRS